MESKTPNTETGRSPGSGGLAVEPPDDARLEDLLRRVPYPAAVCDLVAPALRDQPARFPVLAWCLRGTAVAGMAVLALFVAARRFPGEQPAVSPGEVPLQTLQAESRELQARLTTAQRKLREIARPSAAWDGRDNPSSSEWIGAFRSTSLAQRFDDVESRLDMLRQQLEETPEPPGPRPTTKRAPVQRRAKQRRYA